MELCEGSATYLDPLLVKLFVQALVIISLASTKFHHHLPSQTPTRNSQSVDAAKGHCEGSARQGIPFALKLFVPIPTTK